jgi:glycerophosphoryl diester phosphodiesterase
VNWHRVDKPLVIGHRGAAALAPANTLASFERALDAGVDAIEFDVGALDDGTLVLAHSDDLHDVTAGAHHGTLRGRDLAGVRSLFPELATFEEALEFFVRAPGLGVHVDLKAEGAEAAVAEALRRRDLIDRTLVSSFFHDSLRRLAAVEPRLARGLTYPYDRFGITGRRALAPVVLAGLGAMRAALPSLIGRWLDRAHATVATLHYLVLSRRTIARCHARDVPVLAWTVDRGRSARALARAGVDGIITNDPALVGDTLKS